MKNLADLNYGKQKSKGNKQEKHCNSCGFSGHLGGDPECLPDVRLVGSIKEKILLLVKNQTKKTWG